MAAEQDTLQDPGFVSFLVQELEAGRSLPAVWVLDVKRSMPRDPGAAMVALADGSFLGTVGGGTVERMAEERLARMAEAGDGCGIEWYTHEDTAMACGGDALLGFTVLTPDQLPFLRELQAALDAAAPVWVVQDWSQPDAPTFSVMTSDDLLHGDEAIAPVDSFVWLPDRSLFIEATGVVPRVHIFGAGHVGRALSPVLASVGFVPRIYDDRPAMATPEAFPDAERIEVGDFCELAANAPIGPHDYVVVLTHGHVADIDVLERVIPKEPEYVGCIGSRRKAGIARRTLVERGCDRALVDAACCPIGDDILAVTPPEIAVSIAAQMIRRRASLRPTQPHS
ncbi:XdhC family protein [Olsenella sp. YH-ols2217]|uniref:XdhC family protein n=1 Tax=Kribbibacterium absianum TaxID=3044210 RepID=A0ABT6ZJD9_9ACTN|nr:MULTISPECIES: XdhC/CoxI family protein [unclassified Olsenella]MDJ1121147.1 XdhC family protein [Olsenella sp. YH-ols2216]MDJ1128638.1 XdhC family protein [Olsenella sp. YH-ols2217]